MYKRAFGSEDDSKTDKFKGLVIAFILGAALVWIAPEVMAQMDPCISNSSDLGYLPHTGLTDLMNGGGGNPGPGGGAQSEGATYFSSTGTGLHAHGSGNTHNDDTGHGGDTGPGHTHPASLFPTDADMAAEPYGLLPAAYASSHDTGGCVLDRDSVGSKALQGLVQTVLFVVKILMILGVVGAVGVMSFKTGVKAGA